MSGVPPPRAARLTVELPAAALWHHRPAYAELVHRAHREGLAGASVFQGAGTGPGPSRAGRAGRAGRAAAGRGPCAVVLVDDRARLRRFLLGAAEVLAAAGATAVLERVTVVGPRHRR